VSGFLKQFRPSERSKRKVERVEVKLALHPTDFMRISEAAKHADMSPHDFYALALHIGSTTILHQKGLDLDFQNEVVRLRLN
jgi:hypothetical protein